MVGYPGRSRASIAKAVALLALVLIGGLLVACGGGDDEEPETTVAETTAPAAPSLSKEEIIAEGDAICAEVNAAVAGLESSGATPATQFSQRTDLYTGMVERLRGLDSEDPGLTDVFSAGRDLVQAAAAAEEAAAAGDTEATVAAETTVDAALGAFERVASTYGFSECGGEAGPPVSAGTDPGGEIPESSGETPSETAPSTTEPTTPTSPAGGANAEGGAPPTGGDDGAAGGGAGSDGGAGAGGGQGGGSDSSTGGFSPGG